MEYKDLLKDLKNGHYKPLYFLHGEESYFIDQISKYIEDHALTETEKAFNLTILYGKEANYNLVVDNARRFPLMAERQVVILKEAKEMRDLTALERYVVQPSPTTVLVICHKHKKLDLRTKFATALKKNAVVFESKKLYDNQVPAWIADYLKARKYPIAEDAKALIAEYLGADLSKVANELDKLMLNLPPRTHITTDHVQQHIGISKDYNVFELQTAIGQRDFSKVQRIVAYFIANPKKHPLVQIISSLYGYFSKLYILHSAGQVSDNELAAKLGTRPYFLKDYRVAARNFNRRQTERAIHTLLQYDLKSKGVHRDSTPETELLRELMVHLLR